MSYDPSAFDAFEAAGWAEKDAGAYDMLLGRVTERFAEPLLDAVEAGPGTRLLDLATGPGYVAGRAVERGAEAVGLDRSDAMLEFAREHVPGAEFVRGDVTAIPFEDESFDAVTAAFLLLHLGEPEQARRRGGARARAGRCRGVHGVGRAESRTLARRARRRDRGRRRLGTG